MKKLCLILVTFALWSNTIASSNQQDSLANLSSKTEINQKVHELIELSEQFRSQDPNKSVYYAENAVKLANESDDYELQYLAEFSLGFAQYIQNDFEKALEHLNKALDISTETENIEGQASAANRIGNVYQLMGKYEQALKFYEQAMSINKSTNNNQEIARTLTNLGSVYQLYGNYELAINQHLEALNIYEGLQNNEGIAWSALNIARLFKMLKNYQKSIDYVNQSLEIYQKIEDEENLGTGVTLCLKELGNVYYEMGDLKKAVEYSEQVLERNKQTDNKLGVANSLSNLGKIYFDDGNYKKAYELLVQAKKLKDSLNDNTETSTILRYLGKIYFIQGKASEANKYLKNSLDYAINQNLKEQIKESYFALSEFYEKTNNASKALIYYKLYTSLKDSLNNQKINELELQYEFDKQQRVIEFEQKQKDALQQAKLQKQKIFTWVFVGGFIFMLILAYVIFMNYQRKKKTNQILVKQKKEIEEQRDEIEAQRDFVTKQRDQIAHQNTIITDSIEYASRIQAALFPQEKYLNELLPEHFIFMRPKNIVSGDFYWLTEKDDKLIVVLSDCTGHGVPGAFMSMLGIAFLSEIINKSHEIDPGNVLNQLRERIMESLHQEYGIKGSKDGMDMALCVIDKKSLSMQYAGAYNPVFIVRNKELIELKADKMPIGIHAVKVDKGFTNKDFQLEKNDMVYLFSDGYVDQFGGDKGLKFKQKAFKELLIKISGKSLKQQQKEIEKTMDKWQGEYSQLDDMMIMGIRI